MVDLGVAKNLGNKLKYILDSVHFDRDSVVVG